MKHLFGLPMALPFLLFFFTLANPYAYSQNAEQDSLALVALYNSTSGDDWDDNSNWLSPGNPVSSWYGIDVDSGRVVAINLYGNNLVGTIPDEIGNLTALTSLDLSSNSLSGAIPAGIGQCASLQFFEATVNELSSIPDELAQCTQLIQISLYRNSFSGPFPSALLNMTQLEILDLDSNEFTGSVPEGINDLVNLRRLTLYRNNFEGVMPKIDSLVNIVEFHVSENNLSGNLDEIFGYHPNLYYMNWNNNQFTGCFNSDHFSKDKLELLDISNNNLDCLGDFTEFKVDGVLKRFRSTHNLLNFDELIPVYELNIQDFTYQPQKDLGEPDTVYVAEGGSVTIDFDAGGMGTMYQWYQSGMAVGPASGTGEFTITNFTAATDQGVYYCEATNPTIADLTLKRAPVTTLK